MGRSESAHNIRIAHSTSRWITALLLLVPLTAGCRAPWHQATTVEPSFDQLIEIERKSSNKPAMRDSISARLRPGAGSLASESMRSPLSSELSGLDSRTDIQPHSGALDDPDNSLLRRQIAAAENLLISRQQTRSGTSEELDESTDDDVATFNLNDRSDLQDPAPSPHKPLASGLAAASDRASTPSAGDGREVQPASGVRKLEQSGSTNRDAPHAVETAAAQRPVVDNAPGDSTQRDSTQALHWRDHIRQAIAELEASAESSTNPEQRLTLEQTRRMLDLSVGDLERAMAPVQGLNTDAQEFVRHSLQAWHDLTDPNGNPVQRQRYTLALDSQRKALRHLASASDLEVRNASFCTAVDSYGVISEFAENEFRRDQQLLLYCEVDNFVSLPIPNGKGYETHLQGRYEIVDSSGVRIEDQPLPADQHVSRNPRRDYFIVYRIWTPKSIAAGRYQLKLTIEDLNGHKFGHSTVDFQVVE